MSKEIFLARISAMRSKQAKNSRAITQEDYDNIIKKYSMCPFNCVFCVKLSQQIVHSNVFLFFKGLISKSLVF